MVVVVHNLGPYRVEFWRPPPRALPAPRFSSDILFRYLSPRTVTLALSLILHEQKIIVHAQNEGAHRTGKGRC